MLDLAPLDESDPDSNHATIENELATYQPRLASLPRILALSKADLVPAEQADATAAQWRERLGGDIPVIVTSAATGAGVDELSRALARGVDAAAPVRGPELAELPEHRVFRPADPRKFEVKQVGDGRYRVTGAGIDRLIARHDLDNEEALEHLEGRLRSIGVIGALEAAGFQPGDDVEIAGIDFDFDPERPL